MAGKRGLASADAATRRRVASQGGKASHGGGRKPNRDEYQEAKSGDLAWKVEAFGEEEYR